MLVLCIFFSVGLEKNFSKTNGFHIENHRNLGSDTTQNAGSLLVVTRNPHPGSFFGVDRRSGGDFENFQVFAQDPAICTKTPLGVG